MTYKLCQDVNSENGGTTIQIGILHCTNEHFANIFTAKDTGHVRLFRGAKQIVVSFYVVKKINIRQVAS